MKELSYTRQLRDFNDFAQKEGLDFDLYVRPDTIYSQPLLDAINGRKIRLLTIPGL